MKAVPSGLSWHQQQTEGSKVFLEADVPRAGAHQLPVS